MARIMDFTDRTGHQVYLSIVDSCVHVAISRGKDLLEPKLFSSVLDPKLVQEYLDDLTLVVSIVEELDLNTRIWSK